jgi:hypothetical protein
MRGPHFLRLRSVARIADPWGLYRCPSPPVTVTLHDFPLQIALADKWRRLDAGRIRAVIVTCPRFANHEDASQKTRRKRVSSSLRPYCAPTTCPTAQISDRGSFHGRGWPQYKVRRRRRRTKEIPPAPAQICADHFIVGNLLAYSPGSRFAIQSIRSTKADASCSRRSTPHGTERFSTALV